MTFQEFLNLQHEERLLATETAVCISGRNDGKFMVLLYQLNGFYIEVYYQKKQGRIVGVYVFEDMDLLDPYLEKMQIPLMC